MKKVFVILSLIMLFVFCGCGLFMKRYIYEYSMTTSSSKDMSFNDDKIDIVFSIDEQEINFTLKNKTKDTLKIIWDNATIVLNGKVNKTIHKGVKFINKNEAQPASTIPPNAEIDDLLIPTEHIFYNNIYNQWDCFGLFPTDNRNSSLFPDENITKVILNSKGVKFGLYLPIEYQGKIMDYNFEFQIASVKQK